LSRWPGARRLTATLLWRGWGRLRAGGRHIQNYSGTLSNQGCERSNCPANWNSRSSRPMAALNMRPTGSPSGVQYSGTDMEGWPVMLAMGVKGM
jgi:hypothetical protein